MADLVRLTVVVSQGEADIICALLRTERIGCSEHATDMHPERGGGSGGWREILVEEADLTAGRELLASACA
jgi:hypothetical protein